MQHFVQRSRKIIGVGRNYREHAKELGHPVPQTPLFFLKPPSAFITEGSPIEIPERCLVHHEVELAVIIGKRGRDISAHHAMEVVAGYALALDMTARNLQADAQRKGWPWTLAKGYDTFCPVSRFIAKNELEPLPSVYLWLKVNGQLRQQSSIHPMIMGIPDLIATISAAMTLEEADVILTGTPAGAGPVLAGDQVDAGLGLEGTGDLVTMSFHVIHRNHNHRR